MYKNTTISVNEQDWGQIDGINIKLFIIKNNNGFEVKLTNFGATIVSICTPDKYGTSENVALGFNSLSEYMNEHPYFGCTIGRYANRIAGASFTLNETPYKLNANEGNNTLHGGPTGFHKRAFNVKDIISAEDTASVVFSYLSKDMEEGFPGNLSLTVTFSVTNDNEIRIKYEAETDKSTVINLTNHSYFNLSACRNDILDHNLTIMSDFVTQANEQLIPTGEFLPVKGTPFDFNNQRKIGESIDSVKGGYDINYILNKTANNFDLAAEVYEPSSGRLLQVYTTEPGIQFYSGNFLDGSISGNHQVPYVKYSGFCLETQHFPDSPNKLNFPGVVLEPGENYYQLTSFKFSVK